MNDVTPQSPREIRRAGVTGVASLAGGFALMVLNSMATGFFGLIIGAVVAGAGYFLSRKSDATDRTTGMMAMAAGALAMISVIPFLGGIAHFILGFAGLGLVIMGGINVYKFFKGLKSRS